MNIPVFEILKRLKIKNFNLKWERDSISTFYRLRCKKSFNIIVYILQNSQMF